MDYMQNRKKNSWITSKKKKLKLKIIMTLCPFFLILVIILFIIAGMSEIRNKVEEIFAKIEEFFSPSTEEEKLLLERIQAKDIDDLTIEELILILNNKNAIEDEIFESSIYSREDFLWLLEKTKEKMNVSSILTRAMIKHEKQITLAEAAKETGMVCDITNEESLQKIQEELTKIYSTAPYSGTAEVKREIRKKDEGLTSKENFFSITYYNRTIAGTKDVSYESLYQKYGADWQMVYALSVLHSLENQETNSEQSEITQGQTKNVSLQTTTTNGQQYLGNFRITHYCSCSICCGKWSTGAATVIGASGMVLTPNQSIAVDPGQIPYGSKVMFNGRVYIAADTGVGRNCIDIYTGRDHAVASAGGMYYADVYLVDASSSVGGGSSNNMIQEEIQEDLSIGEEKDTLSLDREYVTKILDALFPSSAIQAIPGNSIEDVKNSLATFSVEDAYYSDEQLEQVTHIDITKGDVWNKNGKMSWRQPYFGLQSFNGILATVTFDISDNTITSYTIKNNWDSFETTLRTLVDENNFDIELFKEIIEPTIGGAAVVEKLEHFQDMEKDTEKETFDYPIILVEASSTNGTLSPNIDSILNVGGKLTPVYRTSPLSEEEINSILQTLNTSPLRKNLIRTALSVVGQIPYSTAGNTITSTQKPAVTDCSGFVKWVYLCNGMDLGANSYSGTLFQNSTEIALSELQPGDTLQLSDSTKEGNYLARHVALFVGWTTDGNMMVVHETGSDVSGGNVKYNVVSPEHYPYRRRLNVMAQDNGVSQETSNPQTPSVSQDSENFNFNFCWPAAAGRTITSHFGPRPIQPVAGTALFHHGMDVSAGAGTPILAAADGVIHYVGNGVDINNAGCGNQVWISHENGRYMTMYNHCSATLVSVGQTVTAGQTIALIGSTGLSTGPHLDFRVYISASYARYDKVSGDYIDPETGNYMIPTDMSGTRYPYASIQYH